MNSSFLPCLRPAAVVAMALGSAPVLTAAITVVLDGPDRRVCPAGRWVNIRVDVKEAPTGQGVEWFLWKNGVPVPHGVDSPFRLIPGGGATFLAPVETGNAVFVLRARCAGVLSGPKAIMVPGVAPAGGGPSGARRPHLDGPKRARVDGPSAAAAPAAPAPAGGAARTAPPASLAGLPSALKGAVAEFTGPGAIKEVNREFAGVARRATRRVTIKNLTDAGLREVVRYHPGLRAINLDQGTSLTPRGILEALNQNRSITSIEGSHCRSFNTEVLLELAATHPRLTRLEVPAEALTEGVLGAFADRLTHLKATDPFLASPPPFPERALAGCHRLATLQVYYVKDFTGGHLPASLKELVVNGSDAPMGASLPAGLERLSVWNCSLFAGERWPASLTHVHLQSCPLVTSERIAAMAHLTPKLVSLDLDLPIREDTLVGFADRLRELRLFNGTGLEHGNFAGFKQLATLDVRQGNAITGAGFPASLRALKLVSCERFQSEFLGTPNLERLEVYRCPLFTGAGVEGPITHLTITDSTACTLTRFKSLLARLPELRTLAFRYWRRGELDPALFQAHPRLQTATTARLVKDPDTTWIRPAGPAAP